MKDRNYIYNLLAVEGEGTEPVVDPIDSSTEGTGEQIETTPEQIPEQVPLSEVEIDGEKFSIDDIKAWKQSNLTTAQFVAQRQELEAMRAQSKDAIELYNYLKSKPDIAQKLYELDSQAPANKIPNPTDERLAQIENQMRIGSIENELKSVMSADKYGANELEILKIATDNRTSIKNAYNLWVGSNVDTILQKQLTDNSKKLTDNIKKNNVITKTIISDGDKTNNSDTTFGLSDMELAFANKIGLEPSEYAKWKSN